MAATPEEFLGQQSFLSRLEPPSPSLFLGLPPTPRGVEDGDSSFDDMALPYISRLLEEDMEDHFFYLYPNHPALLRAQLPFAQILVDVADSASGSTSALSPSSSTSTFDATASTTPSATSPYDAEIQISRPPYTQVLGLASGSPDTQSSALLSGDEEAQNPSSDFVTGNYLLPGDQDMLNMAFLKGMEEAKKFLPPNSSLPAMKVDQVVGGALAGAGLKKKRDTLEPDMGRASKLMMPEQEEDGARELFDEMMFQEHEICMKGVQQLRIAVDSEPGKNRRKKGRPRRDSSDSEMVDLHTLLLNCAQALSTDNRQTAGELLKRIKQHSTPKGDAAQRLAHYFAEALDARLAGRGSELYQSLMARRTSVADFLKANQLYMAACCCKKVAFIFANKTICNAVVGKSRLHIVDYGLSQGLQWPGLLRMLAAREGGPPEVKITGIDLPQPGFHGAYHIEETGRRLSNFARVFGVPFKFHGIAAKRETVQPEDLNIDRDEVLVVISLCHFRLLMDENLGFDTPSPRDQVLNNIRKMLPDVFIHGIMNGSYGATYFLTRFREALFNYSAQFDLLDATVPRDNEGRLLLERDIFGRSALNVIACEGADRVERPETYKQWQLRNHRAGLTQLPLNPDVVRLVLDKVKDNYHKDFVVDDDQRWLLHRKSFAITIAIAITMAATPVFPVFPDLPLMSHDDSNCFAVQDHLTLPYIAQILMEEEDDVDEDNPALLKAQRPFAQILSSSMHASTLMADQGGALAIDVHSPSSPIFKFKGVDEVRSLLLLPDGDYSTHMFSTAFLRGMEEANKFLPTNCELTTTGGHDQPKEKSGRGRKDRHGDVEVDVSRTSRLVEAGAGEVFDQTLIAMGNETGNSNKKGRKSKARVVDLHTLLIHCAKAVMDDRRSAGELLKEIKQHASPTGDATQRLAYWFAEGLEARLTGTGRQVYGLLTAECTSTVRHMQAYQLFMSTCCFRKVAFLFANKAIFNAAVGRSRLHIVDYGLHCGFQWPELLRWLASRDGGPPEVRITHIELPLPGVYPEKHMEQIGNQLTDIAQELGVPFKYRAIMAQWQTICIEDLDMEPDEALAVNDQFNFRTLMDESVVIASPNPRDVVLGNISKMKPDVFVQSTVNGSYGTFFLSRFREALFYHSALFDMLDATMPRESKLRLALERDVFGWMVLNAVAYEGEDRVERGETYKHWQIRNQRAGLRQLPLNRETVKMARDMVMGDYHKDFAIDEDHQWLLQGWKGRILYAHSTWVAEGASSHC
ncbi:unnamed protein product [Triticum turgidum subsp. durum]|uniref:Scarecrow-like protein 9 n=1 Tax=Triticum turgidum subsp. durum TaxID=4567 RepID=A0A9R0SZZ6_TRITD|nr:unnamed protein product [Triticum turgidum subsp. durum]